MHIQSGFSSNQIDISSLNTRVIERSDAKYVLLDNSKFNQCSLIAYAGLVRNRRDFHQYAPRIFLCRKCFRQTDLRYWSRTFPAEPGPIGNYIKGEVFL